MPPTFLLFCLAILGAFFALGLIAYVCLRLYTKRETSDKVVEYFKVGAVILLFGFLAKFLLDVEHV